MPPELKVLKQKQAEERKLKEQQGIIDEEDEEEEENQGPTDEQKKENDQRQFLEMLREKRINASIRWDQTQKMLQNDPRWKLIKQISEKKRLYQDFVQKIKKLERQEQQNKTDKAKEDLVQLLESSNLNSLCKYYKTAQSLIHDVRYKAVEEKTREIIFQDYLDRLFEQEKEIQNANRQIHGEKLLKKLQGLIGEINTQFRWADFVEKFKHDEDYKELHDLDRINVFSEYMYELEKQEYEERRKNKRYQERINRENFRELLRNKISQGEIDHKTKWKKFVQQIKDEPAFLNMLAQSGSSPHELFEDQQDILIENHRDMKSEIKQYIKQTEMKVVADITYDDFIEKMKSLSVFIALEKYLKDFYYHYFIRKAKLKDKENQKKHKKSQRKYLKFLKTLTQLNKDNFFKDFQEIITNELGEEINSQIPLWEREEIFKEYVETLDNEQKLQQQDDQQSVNKDGEEGEISENAQYNRKDDNFGKKKDKDYSSVSESIRFHTSDAIQEKSKMPSGFTMKFRKYIRSKRLEDIKQIGVERVVVLTFGSGEMTNHIILELYSSGNIILTDKDYQIILLIRQHQFNETIKTAIGEKYPFEYAANLYLEKFDLAEEKIINLIRENEEKKYYKDEEDEEKDTKKKKQTQTQKKNKKETNMPQKALKLREIVFKLVPSLHNPVIDHIIQLEGYNPTEKVGLESIEKVQKVANKCKELIIEFQKKGHQGYLVISEKEKANYFEFSPLILNSYQGKQIEQMESFNDCINKYFQKMSKKIEEEQKEDVESIAWKKYLNIKTDQENRIKKLKDEQEEFITKAQLIEENYQDVEAITNILKTMKSSGLAWDKIIKMINEGKKQGDPLANLIHQIDFENNEVSIYLGFIDDQMSELIPVSVDIYQSAHQNARNYYENKRKNVLKEKKTLDATKTALKQAEKTALKEIETQKHKTMQLVNVRKQYWFEKFYWFITSENYLVISGRDSQQNEILVKKYMKKGDIYMHADYHGAASTLIKNPHKDSSFISQQTIEEAAVATICRSKAWEAKIIASAWWVDSHQVSKRAETGEYLPSGSFMIRGKKNFVYPSRMEMACTILFKLNDDSLERHLNDRKRKVNEEVISKDNLNNQIKVESALTEQPSLVEQSSQIETSQLLVSELETTIVNLNIKPTEGMQKKQQQNQKGKQQQKNQKDKSQINQKDKQQNNQKETKQKGNQKKQTSDDDENDNKDDYKNNVNLPRGKKNKVKKMKEKYADQDDEERDIRISRGNKKQDEENQKDAEIDTNSSEQNEEDEEEKEKNAAELNKVEEDIQEEIINSELQDLSRLVTFVYPEDTYSNCLLMCAPFNTINLLNSKFKIKLLPGNLKKGKAGKSVINFFLSQKDAINQEKPIIKGIPEQEIINCLVGNVKLGGAGIQKIKDKEKLAKKQAKKQKEQQEKQEKK
ncbi:hypothetical protein IMG5_099620 [Ichthyophthirius multifiliis]|uniref:FF domain-containing protein n=1 Tax=Ichthyophthirius multifiliis TaxID=5932 RepID=G0QS69_ICHMU|nr:hypothetical protein IMG5_099620 [Ichthyophthirius multifiliis]EGR31934.1 hypothetical protein IMG5_099620 [Ichthyophthirius multifiliis]|eukprot:XP_004035420.1 hypothetical protein IMG5_099620 [Ichthyophthirius multifiliis]